MTPLGLQALSWVLVVFPDVPNVPFRLHKPPKRHPQSPLILFLENSLLSIDFHAFTRLSQLSSPLSLLQEVCLGPQDAAACGSSRDLTEWLLWAKELSV